MKTTNLKYLYYKSLSGRTSGRVEGWKDGEVEDSGENIIRGGGGGVPHFPSVLITSDLCLLFAFRV